MSLKSPSHQFLPDNDLAAPCLGERPDGDPSPKVGIAVRARPNDELVIPPFLKRGDPECVVGQ